jgi:hypothetical protein
VRVRALAAGLLLLALSAMVFTAGAGRGSAPGVTAVVPPPVASPTATPRPPAMPARNVFEYALDETEAPRSAPERLNPPPSVRAEPVMPVPAPEAAVRLVGFVRRPGGLKAALALKGSVYVLAEGEGAEGYVLLAVDEDTGVRITAPDGSILALPPPS